MTEQTSNEENFREQISSFMDDYAINMGFVEGFSTALVSDSVLSAIENVITSNKNAVISSDLTSSLGGLNQQTTLLNANAALKSLSNVIKVLPVASLAVSVYDDWQKGNNYPYETMKSAIAITSGIIIGGLCGGLVIPAIAAGFVGGILDKYWDDVEGKFKDFLEPRVATNTSHTSAESHPSPLVLDLDGDGVETVSVDQGTYFDHDSNGFAENTGWVGTDDGLLVRDLNENGVIDDGTELFGINSVLSSGAIAENGFEALSDLDSNEDGVFNSLDTAWNSVKVWKDADQDGITDEGELVTLENAGVTGINLNYTSQNTTDANNNEHKQTGTFTTTDNTTSTITDVWFDAELSDTKDKTEIELSETISALPDIEGWGNVHNLINVNDNYQLLLMSA